MNPLFAAALRLQSFCQTHQWRFCFIGGLAVQRWGEPRQTKGADLTLLTGFGEEDQFISPLLAAFPGRRPDAHDFASRYRVLLLQDPSGIPFDIALGALPFESRSIDRASPWEIAAGIHLITCSAEDLIVHKAFAARDIDWFDLSGILQRQGPSVDLDLVWSELHPLLALKEDTTTEPRLRNLLDRLPR